MQSSSLSGARGQLGHEEYAPSYEAPSTLASLWSLKLRPAALDLPVGVGEDAEEIPSGRAEGAEVGGIELRGNEAGTRRRLKLLGL